MHCKKFSSKAIPCIAQQLAVTVVVGRIPCVQRVFVCMCISWCLKEKQPPINKHKTPLTGTV